MTATRADGRDDGKALGGELGRELRTTPPAGGDHLYNGPELVALLWRQVNICQHIGDSLQGIVPGAELNDRQGSVPRRHQ